MDDTYLDIIAAAKIGYFQRCRFRCKEEIFKDFTNRLAEKHLHEDCFYLKPGATKLEFNLVAEGLR